MYYKYGQLSFLSGECDLVRTNVTNRISPRGNRLIREVTHNIRALLIADTTADLSSRIQDVQNAFSLDYQDAGLWGDDGVPTKHLLVNDSSCISGVKVLQRSFPEGGGDEYSTARTFSATLYAAYDDADSQLVEWEESLEFIGTCGPVFELTNSWFGPPQFTQVAESSVQHIIQRGSAVGYGAYVIPPGPLFPSNEHLERRDIVLGTPKCMGTQFRYYPISWTYYFSSAIPLSGTPNLR